ncbi:MULTISPECIES: lysophospholipid acyltransferase family protein [Sulfitobacter]|jgi:1-acyl-sn-glycerol-3-phosphate acyltransferase|uniref:lysophospholipid acyltransferase family protein n=1 Tax=Sulfitobacter TaxID=60136 RepID=UPI000E8A8797|nr:MULTISPECIES: lysophospholipid acyltransferase family protein [Sulfitobacter]HAR84002.1 1-acyl-sn-glycerol-3-phosphate acyltransferase [Sulfitobacter pontiacus]HBR40210.1 1-acyl-sn-glycerol-3-phosphate acyltransferase [Sulfitobacter pontiacus]|tara:strand:- start:7318 stop:8172 length:855 start_codon:yes stop_codon:yes gene_type:complete
MSAAWDSADHPTPVSVGPLGWVLMLLRGVLLATVVLVGLVILLAIRLIERPLYGQGRPVTPHITQIVCKTAFWIMGLRRAVIGTPMRHRGAVVANHTSWLDIFSLNAAQRIYFVSKSEVASWPGIGWLAKATGTLFIERNPKHARKQTEVFQQRLLDNHRLLFFPEGTSTDGQQVLPFKTTLFQSFFAPELRDVIWVQPVTVIYTAPNGTDPRFYGWWGDMSFGGHLLRTLASLRQGQVTTIYHTPLAVADFENRKALAQACEAQVRAAHPSAGLAAPNPAELR